MGTSSEQEHFRLQVTASVLGNEAEVFALNLPSILSHRDVFSGGLLAQGLHPTVAKVGLWSSLECSFGGPHLLFSEEVHGHTPSRRSGG